LGLNVDNKKLSLVCLLCAAVTGCGGAHYGRIGPPVALPNGPPRTSCEREEWYYAARARVLAQGTTAGVFFNTHYFQAHEGLGVFRTGHKDPQDLDDVLPRMREPKLRRLHEARIEPVDAAERRSLHWALGGLFGLFAGIGAAAALQDESEEVATAAGVTGLAAGIVGVAGALAAQPSGEDQVYADARRKLFILHEDDLRAVARGINTVNSQRRRKCGGRPVPFLDRAPPPAPKPTPPPEPDDRGTSEQPDNVQPETSPEPAGTPVDAGETPAPAEAPQD
jgi:hypothetical protein